MQYPKKRTPLPPEVRAQITEKNRIRRFLQRIHDLSLRQELIKDQRELDTALQEIHDGAL